MSFTTKQSDNVVIDELLESLTIEIKASEEEVTVDCERPKASLAEELEDLVCAICLDHVQPEDSAFIKDCQHMYCVGCILKWSLVKDDDVSCPKCKAKFSFLYTYRSLDGTLHEFPQEESVCLLKRASWFEDAFGNFKGKALATSEEPDIPEEWYDEYFEEEDDDDYDEYMASSGLVGHRNRVMLGNRRWGSNGYIQAGRMQARPVHTPRPSKGEARAARKEKDISCEPGRSRHHGGGKKASPVAGTSPPSRSNSMINSHEPSPSGGGRRARRAAKRAEIDVGG